MYTLAKGCFLANYKGPMDNMELSRKIVSGHFKRKGKRSDSVLWQKPLHPQKKIQKATWQHEKKKRHQNFDYIPIADRLRTVSWV